MRLGWAALLRDRIDHNSHVLVLRKRHAPRTRPLSINIGRTAMKRVRNSGSFKFNSSDEPAIGEGDEAPAGVGE